MRIYEGVVERASVDPQEVEDVVMGCGMPEGATGKNIARGFRRIVATGPEIAVEPNYDAALAALNA